jgi:hypothetical protein
MSREWIEEVELSSEEIQIRAPSLTIQCKICDDLVDVLYNPTVAADIMSTSFVSAYFGKEPLAPTNKSLRIGPHSSLKGCGILHNTTIHHHHVIMALDFHIFDIQDFDIMIGHPLEKLFVDPMKTGDLDVKLGRESFSIQVTRAKNLVAEPLPYHNLPSKVMSVMPFELTESSLETDAKLFIEEEDDLGETIDLSKVEAMARPPVELKLLPAHLRYAFLNGDT